MSKRIENLAEKMFDIGLPYNATDCLGFVLSGGTSVVAMWTHGEESASFVGFGYEEGDKRDEVVSAARGIKGVHTVYVVKAEAQVL